MLLESNSGDIQDCGDDNVMSQNVTDHDNTGYLTSNYASETDHPMRVDSASDNFVNLECDSVLNEGNVSPRTQIFEQVDCTEGNVNVDNENENDWFSELFGDVGNDEPSLDWFDVFGLGNEDILFQDEEESSTNQILSLQLKRVCY